MLYLQHDITLLSRKKKKNPEVSQNLINKQDYSKVVDVPKKKKSWMYIFHLTLTGISIHAKNYEESPPD